MPDLSNPDEVALHIAKLVSENHALRNERNLATNSSPQIKRSHSFQPSKIDEHKGQRFLGLKLRPSLTLCGKSQHFLIL